MDKVLFNYYCDIINVPQEFQTTPAVPGSLVGTVFKYSDVA